MIILIGTKIKNFRLVKKQTQKEVAEAVGISQSTLSDIELNKYEPKLKLSNDIAVFLGVSLEDLLAKEEVTK